MLSPIPPCTYTGVVSAASSCCESTKAPCSPIQPPASWPLAITASALACSAARASSSRPATTRACNPAVWTDSTRLPSDSAGRFARTMASSVSPPAARTLSSTSRSSIRAPARPRPSAQRRRSCASPASRSSPNSRLTTPSAPARAAAIGTAASGEPVGDNTMNSNKLRQPHPVRARAPKKLPTCKDFGPAGRAGQE